MTPAPGDRAELQQRLGLAFGDPDWLEQALVHRSYLNENPHFRFASNERLEFLGDAILSYTVAVRLFRDYPSLPEGDLTGLRTALVRTETLARLAQDLNLGEYLYLGRGEEATGGRARPVTLAGALEAIIGAVYLDQGTAAAEDLIGRLLDPELKRSVEDKLTKDYKSRLQERLQRERGVTPFYRTVAAAGPDHAKVFTVEVLAGGEMMGSGTGRSKQSAEQEAAERALTALEEQE